MENIKPEEFFCENRIKRKRPFMFLRSFLDLSYKSGEISESNYLKICKILDEEEERMTLESEE